MFANTQPEQLLNTITNPSSDRAVKDRSLDRLEKLFETWDNQGRVNRDDLPFIMKASAAVAQHLSESPRGRNFSPADMALANKVTCYVIGNHLLTTDDCGHTLLSGLARQSIQERDHLQLAGCLVNFAAAAEQAADCTNPAFDRLKKDFKTFTKEAEKLAELDPSPVTSRMTTLINHLTTYVASLEPDRGELVIPPMSGVVKESLRDVGDLTWELRQQGWNQAAGARFKGMMSSHQSNNLETFFQVAFLTPELQQSVKELLSPGNAMLPNNELANILEETVRNSGILPGLRNASRDWLVIGLLAQFRDRTTPG